MNSSHTPRNWSLVTPPSHSYENFRYVTGEKLEQIATVHQKFPSMRIAEDQMMSQSEALANAKLIAAAPGLLEALQALIDVTEGQSIYNFMKPQRDAAKAAIKKATNQ